MADARRRAVREWFVDLLEAADELGYGVLEVAKARIVLVPITDPSATITIASVRLNAQYLRLVLLARPA